MKIKEDLSIQRNICLHYGGRNIPHSKGSEKGVEERRTQKVWVSVVGLALFLSFIPIIVEIVPTVSSGLIEVDDSGGKDYLTIQTGVDAAQPGDTVLVYAGIYYEDVVIDKTLNLTGEDRDTTIINSTDKMGIYVTNADFVNISGFTVENTSWGAIRIRYSNNSLIVNNKIQNSQDGIQFLSVNTSVISNNIYTNIYSNAIYLSESSNNLVNNNTATKSGWGLWLDSNSQLNTVINNNFSYNEHGLTLTTGSRKNIIKNNIFNYNNGIFVYHTGISLGTSANDNTFINNTIKSNKYGILANSVTGNIFINSTITQSEIFDIHIKGGVELTLLNSTFNKSSVEFTKTTSTLTVQWYLHVIIIDSLGNPIPKVKVKIKDDINGSYNETFTTGGNGYLRWLPITEYIEQDINDDSIGEKKYNTPHQIIAWNDTLVGYAQPFMNESKTITIILYNGTLLDLELGWNLISLPRIQSDTNLQTILQSIEGQYDAVQRYNVTDTNDPWKHHHISKSPNLNDLDRINHTMGFWLHITYLQGTILVVYGNELTFNQDISLYPGWNHVGFPSQTNKTRDVGLGTLNFGTDIDSIWTYNTTTQKWIELNDAMDYFVVGQGYWIHSKVEKVWDVPL